MEELNFNEWFTLFLKEKGLSDIVIEFEDKYAWHHMPIQVVREYLSFCNEEVQLKIKSKLVELDFCNISISNFLEYIARGIGKEE
ncbi:hypothetical protein LCGC14_2529900 [marine sediment metagenome]|uniref:Uncharacterized protein n=1 Tax=marine sediment metagenome TaxID=412755 RepID=A0A0F9ATV1_9ZZZZ